MNNTIGNIFRFTIWGASHAPAVGVTIEGIPEGTGIDMDRLQAFLNRRRPGQDALSTARKESDRIEFTGGVTLTGQKAVVCDPFVTAMIRNTDTRPEDYDDLRFVPRPGHADFAAMARFGEERELAGGGQFSGRMTAPLCIAGGIAEQILEQYRVRISAMPLRIGGETDPERMRAAIENAAEEGDSIGGIVECVIEGLPAGIGEPMFDGIENRIAQMVFGIPAVKGIEFGAGFAAADLKGSENNDAFEAVSQANDRNMTFRVRTRTNHHGGALGGLSSGMPVVFRAAFKPTPSIAKEQDSVDIRTGEPVRLRIRGRHDPCIVLRAVPVVEAAAAAAVYDLLLAYEAEKASRHALSRDGMEELRAEIDTADEEIIRAFEKRMDAAAKIGQYKKEHGLPILDAAREREKLAAIGSRVRTELWPYYGELYAGIFGLSKKYQQEMMRDRAEGEAETADQDGTDGRKK